MYGLDEFLGTKLRALYQRRKGRDPFDLDLAIRSGMVDPALVVDSFLRYMEKARCRVAPVQFEENLAGKSKARVSNADIMPRLASGHVWEAESVWVRPESMNIYGACK